MTKGTHYYKWGYDLLYDGVRAILNTDYRGLPSLEVNLDVEGRLEQLIKEVEIASVDDPQFGADHLQELEHKIAKAAVNMELQNNGGNEQIHVNAMNAYNQAVSEYILVQQQQLVADVMQETSK
jgi:hypothetical protein